MLVDVYCLHRFGLIRYNIDVTAEKNLLVVCYIVV